MYESILFQSNRQTGRTTQTIKEAMLVLNKGRTPRIVCHNNQMASTVQNMINEMYGNACHTGPIVMLTLADVDRGALRGVDPEDVFFDHHAIEVLAAGSFDYKQKLNDIKSYITMIGI